MPKVSFNVNYNDILTIRGKESRFNQYYQLDSPFSFVLETYSASGEQSFINIANFTPDDIRSTTLCDAGRIAAARNRCLHQHDFYEIMFVLEGTVINTIENTQRTYRRGSGCLLNRNLRHAERFDSDFRVFFLNISKEYVSRMIDRHTELYFREEERFFQSDILRFLTENEGEKHGNTKEYLDFTPVHGNTYGYNRVYEIGENISKTMLSPNYGSTALINGYIASLFAALCDAEAFHITDVKMDYGNDFLIFSAACHLIEDTSGRISREELSKALSYSGDYINRVIKKYSGMNLSGYCMEIRMKNALNMIKASDLSISEIAYELGFKNRNHFYQHFKQKYGAMPSSFRKNE